jgi:hypothetical protein
MRISFAQKIKKTKLATAPDYNGLQREPQPISRTCAGLDAKDFIALE